MIKFYLYSDENKNGLKLCEVLDESTAYVLSQHYKSIYNKDKFLVTKKYPRKKETVLCGGYNAS